MMVSRCTATALLALAAGCALAGPADMPKRKPGLWQISNTMPGMPSMGPVQHCIDGSTDNLYKQMGEDAQNKCSPPDVKRDGGKVILRSTCKMGKATASTEAVFSGDFDSAYRGDINVKYDPPLNGMSQTKMTLEAKWLGACKPGQKPGDIVTPNGMTITAEQMKQAAEQARQMRQQHQMPKH